MESMKQLTKYLLLLCLIVFTSCDKETAPDCFKKAGEEVTVRRELSAFNEIEITDYLFIELIQSADRHIEVVGPKNILPKIITEVSDEKLFIENTNTCNFVRSFKNRVTIKIYAPSFTYITNRGTGDIKSIGTLSGSYLKIENKHASGKIELNFEGDSLAAYTQTGVSEMLIKGEVTKVELFNQGLGLMDARDLRSHEAYVNNSTINDIYVNTDGYLFGRIDFSGNIYVRSNPTQIDQAITGSGKIIAIP